MVQVPKMNAISGDDDVMMLMLDMVVVMRKRRDDERQKLSLSHFAFAIALLSG